MKWATRSRVPWAKLWLLVMVLCMGVGGCGSCHPVNANAGLRWWLFANYGAGRMCPEMMKRGVPIKIQKLGPNSVGRFFPERCSAAIHNEDRSVYLDVTGSGYAYTSMTKRIGFAATLQVEFKPDFRVADDSLYVWGRFYRMPYRPQIRILGVENPVINLATQLPIGGNVAEMLSQGIISSQIARGFTVVRSDDGDDFTLGILQPPAKPVRPFSNPEERYVLATDTTEIRPRQRDYLGPFEVRGNDKGLYMRFRNRGAPLNVYLVDKLTGDRWRVPYQQARPLGGPPGRVLVTARVNNGDSQNYTPLRAGYYFLVVENANAAPLSPLGVPLPLPQQMSVLSYSISWGDRP